MAYALHYRLTDAELDEDLRQQTALFRELDIHRPPWLGVRAYQLDTHTRALLLEVDDVAWLEELPTLSAYLRGLEQRCDGAPRAGRLEADELEATTGEQTGAWDPLAGHVTIPTPTTLTPPEAPAPPV